MDSDAVRRALVGEIGLSGEQAAAFVAVTSGGPMTAPQIAEAAGISDAGGGEGGAAAAAAVAGSLVAAGAFIDMPGGRYEAMHPRFTAVNMYRRSCERRGVQFGRNDAVDMVGAALENAYDAARTSGGS